MKMFKMFRLRRYRVFLICAIVMTVILVRMSRLRQWEYDSPNFNSLPSSWKGHTSENYKSQYPSSLEGEPKSPSVDVEHLGHSSAPESYSPLQEHVTRPSKTSSSSQSLMTSTSEVSIETDIPDRKLPDSEPEKSEEDTTIHQDPPSRVEPVTFEPTPSEIHWQKQPEHFPVPIESLIQLPTGKPVSIPRIQHIFSDESNLAKDKREQRLAKVKGEFIRAWNGYKEHAWMHDEIKPVSGSYRDPFCGWAATLVDSLDTLWIMGLEEDFEEAVKAVGTIDFTTSPRSDIPVFETTIRYLGGLLAAYDVSGGNHNILLDKAVELAEVLMGAFDTPNRMPLLFYRWRSDYSSQAHRASTRANLAELGSLSMEFTRLAQLTKQSKYYDAVARITNALEEWQNRGTNLPGVFPDNVDASGCNRSAPFVNNAVPSATALSLASTEEAIGYEPSMPENVAEPKPLRGKMPKVNEDLEFSITPGQPGKGHLKVIQEGMESTITPGEPGKARLKVVEETGVSSEGKTLKLSKRTGEIEMYSNTTATNKADNPVKKDNGASVSKPTTTDPDWDCVPQGLTSVGFDHDAFSMGAGQDSTYEYFSKQYLLLGGLEPKYRDMYLKTLDAVRTHMLYRPMVPDDREILFSGKVHTKGNTIDWVEYEATHLTCFLGGMVGMGSRVFDLNDLETAKKLANGCVWAYESMAAGIMPESMHVVPCEKASDCHWNETVWTHALDPLAGERDQMIRDYETKKAKHEAEMEAAKLASDARLAAEQKDKDAAAEAELLKQTATDFYTSKSDHGNGVDVDSAPPVSTRYEDDPTSNTTVSSGPESKSSIQKRAPAEEDPKTDSATASSDEINISKERLDEKIKDTETELKSAAPGREIDIPSSYVPEIPTPGEMTPDPMRPLSHKEYVASKIELEGLPPSVVKFHDMYILRPEAIESVWYMYRITGDTTWQDKGWIMFEHIINATRTNYGHSAISGLSRGEPTQKDEMESFWLAETLKYFYLLYSTPDKISLDEWVFNTEAHPFKRPKSP